MQYADIIAAIYDLMNKGEANLTTVELKKLGAMSLAAEKHEDEVLRLQHFIKSFYKTFIS